MNLALKNLLHSKIRLAVTVVGVGFAVYLMIFQGSLLVGFLGASSRVIDATDVDLWVTARGVPCLEFSARIPERYRSIAQGVEGVTAVESVVSGLAAWKKPDGVEQTVIVLGSDGGPGLDLPRPEETPGVALPDTVVVDRSDLDLLGLEGSSGEVEINGLQARVLDPVSGFGSFIGSPYVFTSSRNAIDYLRFRRLDTTFLLVTLEDGYSREVVRRELLARLPGVSVHTRDGFAAQSRRHWLTQTGAGGAILMAGLLGFVVGTVIVSQTTYATTMEHLGEFATLKALGASAMFLRRVVLLQALASGMAGYALGYGFSVPALLAARSSIPWAETPWWLPAMLLGVTVVMCSAAALLSIRKAMQAEPASVFRA